MGGGVRAGPKGPSGPLLGGGHPPFGALGAQGAGRGYVPKSRKEHTEYLWSLLAEMQSVARWDREAKAW